MYTIINAFIYLFIYLFNILFSPLGTRGFESEEKDRPQFHGDKLEPLRRSFVNNRKETYFPEIKRTYLAIGSSIAIFIAILFISGFFGAIFYAEYLVQYKYPNYKFLYFEWVIVFFIAISIEIFSYIYLGFSGILANYENHRTETNYEDSLIAKTVFFKIFNHYGALVFTVFGKGPILGTFVYRTYMLCTFIYCAYMPSTCLLCTLCLRLLCVRFLCVRILHVHAVCARFLYLHASTGNRYQTS